MSIIDASVLLISALFSIYALASAVEYGIVFKMLGRDQASRKLFTPLWEITNVFLVFGFTGLAILFNGALTHLSHALMGTLGAAIVLMLIRSCLVLSIFYIRNDDIIPSWLLWPFALVTFLVPLSFSSAGVYLLTGQLFWRSVVGATLIVGATAGLAAVGLLVVNRKQKLKDQFAGQLTFIVWLLILGCILPLLVQHVSNNLQQWPLAVLVGLSTVGLGLVLAGLRRGIRLWQYAALVCLMVPILLAWADRPYLVSGQLTLSASYGAQTYGTAIVIGLIVMLPLIILGGWLFIVLFNSPKD